MKSNITNILLNYINLIIIYNIVSKHVLEKQTEQRIVDQFGDFSRPNEIAVTKRWIRDPDGFLKISQTAGQPRRVLFNPKSNKESHQQ